MNCQLCGSAALERFDVPGRTLLWKCPPCELYQHGTQAGEEDYAQAELAPYEKYRRRKRRTAALRLNRLAVYLDAARPRVLDIGCNVGCTVEAARDRGWDAYGVDLSRYAVRLCRERGLACSPTDGLHLPFEDAFFDAVVAWHVIEHVADVRRTLAEWRRVLRPGGVMVLETPDASSPRVRREGAAYARFWKPEHTYAFTPANLRAFVAAAGFDLLTEPRTGSLAGMDPLTATWSLGRWVYQRGRRAAGLQKAFQLFARRSAASTEGTP